MADALVGTIRLSFASKEQVVVIPENEDRFITTASAAAAACQQALDSRFFDEQFSAMLGFLHQWCVERPDKVRACYVTVGDHGLNVIVCTHTHDYNFDFDDEIAELDLSLFQNFPLCKTDVLQLPQQDALTNQFPSDAVTSDALVVHADSPEPS